MILELKHINFFFSHDNLLLKDITLSLKEKCIYALMGSNGAGKTTLFNLISGFLKPNIGDIFFKGKNVTHIKPYIINRLGISRTFQDLRLITKLTVTENIVLAMQQNPTDIWFNAILLKGFHKNKIKSLVKKANEIVEQFFLNDVKNSLASEISYGQQKLLTLACCVANGATLLLLDEAVAGVQPEYRDKIAILIKQLKERGSTILLIEHNTDFIANVADIIFFLHEGKIFTYENMESLKMDGKAMEAYT